MNDIQTALKSVLRSQTLPDIHLNEPLAAQTQLGADGDVKAAVQTALKDVLGNKPSKNG